MGTNTGTVMTLANSIIGVGVLAMPFCFKQCGIILSILMLLLSSFLSRLACHFLLKAAIMARRRNFEFLAFHTFGPPGKTVVELCIIGFLMGTCIAFFVVVGDLGPAIVAKTLNINNTGSLREIVLIGLALFVVLPLGLLRNVDSLSSVCMATIGFYLCLVLKVIAEAMPHLVASDWVDKVSLWRPAGMLQCIPIFSMALFCQTQLFEIYESLPNASLDKMNDVIRAAVNLCTAFYICVGFFGYVAFCTQNFTGNILMSFTPTLISDVIKMGFVLSVGVSFPLVIFPCRASLYSLLFKRVQMPHHETVSTHIPETRFKCLTIGIICVSLTVGLLIPNIELVLGLVGSTIGVLICVMFPAVAFICISTKSTQERLLAQVLVFVGVLILVLGTYATLYAANESGNEDKVQAISPQPDHFDNVARMTVIQVNIPVVDDIAAVKLNEGGADPKKEALGGNKDTDGQNPQVQQLDLPRKPDVRQEPPVPVEPAALPSASVPEKKEPKEIIQQIEETAHHDSDIKKDVAVAAPEEKKILDPEADRGKGNNEQVDQDAIKKEDEELAEAEKQAQADSEQKNEELLRKLEKHKEEQKKLLQEQKQILEELKEHKKDIEQSVAKQRNDDKVPQGLPDKIQGDIGVKPEGKDNEKNHLHDKKQSLDNNAGPQNGVPLVKTLQNKSNIVNDIKKSQNEIAQEQKNGERKDAEPQTVKSDPPKKATAEPRPSHTNEIQQGPPNLMLQDTPKAASLNASNVKLNGSAHQQAQDLKPQDQKLADLVQQQDKPAPAQKKLMLPLPLAVHNGASKAYKQIETIAQGNKADTIINSQKVANQQNGANVDEAKVMRRDILANYENGYKAYTNQDGEKVNSELDTAINDKYRDILSNNMNKDKLYGGKNESHERQKRDAPMEESEMDTFLVASIMNKEKNEQDISNVIQGDVLENCAVGEKVNKINEAETLNIATLSKEKYNIADDQKDEEPPYVSEKYIASPQIFDLGTVPYPERTAEVIESASEHSPDSKANASSTDANVSGSQKREGFVSGETKAQADPEDKVVIVLGDVSTSSSIIKTPSHLSEPKLNDGEIKLLDEAVINAKDVSLVAKPMTRDLKSVSAVQQVHENNEHNETKDT